MMRTLKAANAPVVQIFRLLNLFKKNMMLITKIRFYLYNPL